MGAKNCAVSARTRGTCRLAAARTRDIVSFGSGASDFMIDIRVFLCRLCGSNVKLSTPLSDAHTTGRRERHSRKTPFRPRAGLVFILRRLDAPSCRNPFPLTLLIPCEVSRG